MQKQTLSLVFTLLSITPLLTPLACSDDEAPKGPAAGGSAGAGGSSGAGGTSDGGGGITCAEMCAKLAPLGCSKGPPSESLCVAFCNGIVSGMDATCSSAMKGLLSCATPSIAVQCDAEGNATSADCTSEFAAIVPCLPST
jgi:hypothetical protein